MSKKVEDIPAYEENVSWSVATVSTYINEHDEESLRSALYSMRDKQGQLTQLVELFSSVPTQFIQNVSSNFTLPEKIKSKMGLATGVVKKRFFEAATVGLKAGGKEASSPKFKKRLVATVGAAGGAWLAALPADLILSTGLMLREIALIAQQEGFDIKEQAVIDACWDIYFLKEELSSQEAGKAHMVPARALLRGQSLGFLITDIVGKYGISVSRYTLHKLFPVAGALCGASLNVAFLEQYRAMAKIYFIMHRIKNLHGEAALEEFRSQFIN